MTISEQLQEMFPDAGALAELDELVKALTTPLDTDESKRPPTALIAELMQSHLDTAKMMGMTKEQVDGTGFPAMFAELAFRLGTIYGTCLKIQKRRLDKKPVR